MNKLYTLLEPEELDPLFGNRLYHDFAVAVFHWLIDELYSLLKDQLIEVQIQVIRVSHHHPDNVYPALGIHRENANLPPNIIELIESTISQLLREKTVIELISFIAANGIDWTAVTKKILRET